MSVEYSQENGGRKVEIKRTKDFEQNHHSRGGQNHHLIHFLETI
jgi:hypothetical protein